MPPGSHPITVDLGRRAATVVIDPPVAAPGYWAGGPSALRSGGAVWLAYRLRRPVDAGRGYLNVVARSEDGYEFETVAEVTSAQFDCASLERPALAVGPDGTWHLFVSCSTEGSKHWWVESITASRPEDLATGERHMILPGDEATAWKDPVVSIEGGAWRMWACRHDIIPPEEADRMDSWYATSRDGSRWDVEGRALGPGAAGWDRRGARITSVLPDGCGGWLAFYDGRASAAENWEERTGLAAGPGPEEFAPVGSGPLVAAPSIRYLSVVTFDTHWLVYYEFSRPDGAHDLRAEYVPRPTGFSQSA
jgi:hypothetical protein